jgi:DNA-binding PadR family transcriptional regulator
VEPSRKGRTKVSVSRVDLIVLGLLADEPLYGYDLLERFRERSMGFWTDLAKASVYQALRRLERRGLIGGRDQAGTQGPDRRVFRISRAGRALLRDGLQERFGELAPFETEAGLALGFSGLLTPPQARGARAERERTLRELIDRLNSERVRTHEDRSPGRAVSNAMLDRQEALARAELGWLATFREGKRR